MSEILSVKEASSRMFIKICCMRLRTLLREKLEKAHESYHTLEVYDQAVQELLTELERS